MTRASRAADRLRVETEIGLPATGGPQRFALRSGATFATAYERVVYGDRGPYVEFTREQIVAPLRLLHRATWNDPHRLPAEDCGFYYLWMVPEGDDGATKVYWQIKGVAYADYKRGFYYVSPWDLVAVGCVPMGLPLGMLGAVHVLRREPGEPQLLGECEVCGRTNVLDGDPCEGPPPTHR